MRKIAAVATFLLLAAAVPALAAEKLKVGSAVKVYAGYYLPILAAEEKGFWKENGLEVEWVPFMASPPLYQAVAAGSINFGMSPVDAAIDSAIKGLPVVIAGTLIPDDPFLVWVKSDSKYKEPRDLKGKKIGAPRLVGATYTYGKVVARSLGIEKDVEFIAVGGLPETIAALRTSSVDAMVQPLAIGAGLKAAGILREIGTLNDFLPKDWIEHVIFVEKKFAASNPDTVKRALRALYQGIDFARNNPAWALAKMKELNGYPDEAAKLVYASIKFSRDGKVDGRALENVQKFLGEYEVIPKDKMVPVDQLYTNRFLE